MEECTIASSSMSNEFVTCMKSLFRQFGEEFCIRIYGVDTIGILQRDTLTTHHCCSILRTITGPVAQSILGLDIW